MRMNYNQLIKASKQDIETIRKQDEVYRRPRLLPQQLEKLRMHISALYNCNAQSAFAYRIYMKAR